MGFGQSVWGMAQGAERMGHGAQLRAHGAWRRELSVWGMACGEGQDNLSSNICSLSFDIGLRGRKAQSYRLEAERHSSFGVRLSKVGMRNGRAENPKLKAHNS